MLWPYRANGLMTEGNPPIDADIPRPKGRGFTPDFGNLTAKGVTQVVWTKFGGDSLARIINVHEAKTHL